MTNNKKINIDFDTVSKYLELTTQHENEHVHLQLFSDHAKNISPKHLAVNIKDVNTEVESYSNMGYGIFVTIHETDGQGRKNENIIKLRALVIDGDEGEMPTNFPIPPTFIVCRKNNPNKYHAYWLIADSDGNLYDAKEDTHAQRWSQLQQRLALYYGTDPKIKDLARVMRLPGTIHRKDPENPDMYKFHQINDPSKRYTMDEMEEAHPLTAEQQALLTKNKKDRYSAKRQKMHNNKAIKSQQFYDSEQEKIMFIHHLKHAEIAVSEKQGNHTTYTIACKGRDFGLSPKITLQLMQSHWNNRCQPPWDDEELLGIVSNAYEYAQNDIGCDTIDYQFSNLSWYERLDMTKSGSLKTHTSNAILILENWEELQNLLAYNELTNTMVLKKIPAWIDERDCQSAPRNINDSDIIKITDYIHHKFMPFPIAEKQMRDAVVVASQKKSFHPIKDMINSVEWDGTKRLDHWLNKATGCDDNEYTQAVGRKFIVAMVARVFHPGCKFDMMPVFEGKQGCGKSTLLKALAGEYFADSPPPLNSKDFLQYINQFWLIEWQELSVYNKSDVNTIKSIITTCTDKFRLPYAKLVDSYPRQCVFAATTNQENYLKDETGNRRFLPIKIGHDKIDIDYVKEIRSQLFAEALVAFKEKEKLYLEGKALEIAKSEQLNRHDSDILEDVFLEAIHKKEKIDKVNIDRITTLEVWHMLHSWTDNNKYNYDPRMQKRIRAFMTKLGWKPCKVIRDGKNLRGYKRPGVIDSKA